MSTPLQRLQTGSGWKGSFAETGPGLQAVPRWTAYEQYAGCHYSRNNGVLPLVTSGSCIVDYHKPETYTVSGFYLCRCMGHFIHCPGVCAGNRETGIHYG